MHVLQLQRLLLNLWGFFVYKYQGFLPWPCPLPSHSCQKVAQECGLQKEKRLVTPDLNTKTLKGSRVSSPTASIYEVWKSFYSAKIKTLNGLVQILTTQARKMNLAQSQPSLPHRVDANDFLNQGMPRYGALSTL